MHHTMILRVSFRLLMYLEQSKPSVVSIAKKRNTILRVKGWRIGRISEDLDKMVRWDSGKLIDRNEGSNLVE